MDSLARRAMLEGVEPIAMPVPLSSSSRLEFSFSGLKNAFRLALQKEEKLCRLIESNLAHLASRQKAAKEASLNQSTLEDIQACDGGLRDEILSCRATLALALGLQLSAVAHLKQKCKIYLQGAPKFCLLYTSPSPRDHG